MPALGNLPLPTHPHACPDATYFTTADVRPYVHEGTLHYYEGRGSYRGSWGSPNVRTTITAITEEVIRCEVVGWHKHTVSPVGGFYYFVLEGNTWIRRTAQHKRVKAALQAMQQRLDQQQAARRLTAYYQTLFGEQPELKRSQDAAPSHRFILLSDGAQ